MKRFFARFSLLFVPIVWALFVLFAAFFHLIDDMADLNIRLSFLFMGGCLTLSVLFSSFGQGYTNKTSACIGMLFAIIHFIPLVLDGYIHSEYKMDSFLSYFQTGPLLITCAVAVMIIVSAILTLCRKKAPKETAVPAFAAASASPADAAQLQELQNGMNNVMQRLQQMDFLKTALENLFAQNKEIQLKIENLSHIQVAVPENIPVKEVSPAKKKILPVEDAVPEEGAPAEEAAPAEESHAKKIAVEDTAAEDTPAEEEIPVEPAEEAAPAANPVPQMDGSQYVLLGGKGSCIVNKYGVHYQLKDQNFFANYSAIDNLYTTLGVYYIMYKGKDYHIDVYQRTGEERDMLKSAFAYAQVQWNAAKAASASAPVAVNEDDAPVYTVETNMSILKVYSTYSLLKAKRNAVNLLVTNKFYAGEKKFYYSDLTAVQFREPGAITDGYLEFEYPGSRSGNNAAAYTSENAIAFAKPHLPLMKNVYAFIDGKIRSAKEEKNRSVVAALSPAEELKKYKGLLDSGIISQEEFNAKKKQLLGL